MPRSELGAIHGASSQLHPVRQAPLLGSSPQSSSEVTGWSAICSALHRVSVRAFAGRRPLRIGAGTQDDAGYKPTACAAGMRFAATEECENTDPSDRPPSIAAPVSFARDRNENRSIARASVPHQRERQLHSCIADRRQEPPQRNSKW